MSHCSILPWIEQILAKAGAIDGLKAKNLLAQKILMNGTTLDILLDETHPTSVAFSATAERLVRRLLLLGESMTVYKKISSESCTTESWPF